MEVGNQTVWLRQLSRLGLNESTSVQALQYPDVLNHLSAFASAADVDRAMTVVLQLIDSGAFDVQGWTENQWSTIADLCGFSITLGEHLINQPLHVASVLTFGDLPSPEQMYEILAISKRCGNWQDALDCLRVEYRRIVAMIAAHDVHRGSASFALVDRVSRTLSDLAQAVIAVALELAQQHSTESAKCTMAIIAMGKCGGQELNYVSDVDVLFIARPTQGIETEEALKVATSLAKSVIAACSSVTGQGTIWELDPNLRPEGRSGALVRTLESYLDYYQRWAETWEFQALLKARPIAGDMDLGSAFIYEISPMVWDAASRPNFVQDVQAMREQVTTQIPRQVADIELKLGHGGLRDIEFAVQLLQLVHGRSDVLIRSANTLTALEQLATWGYVGREDAYTLAEAYKFLRTVEHRIQLLRLRRTHLMPKDSNERMLIARSLGFSGDPVESFNQAWNKHAREVRRIHEKLFFRPLLDAVAKLHVKDARLNLGEIQNRLLALGYLNPDFAISHIEALTSGLGRRAVIQRTLLPVLLEWFAQGPDPDGALLAFRRVSESLGGTPWFLRFLRDESMAAQRLAKLLSTSQYSTELLLRAPEALAMLADDDMLIPRSLEQLQTQAESIMDRYANTAEVIRSLRTLRRLEMFRISAADALGLITVQDVGAALTAIADVVLSYSLRAIKREYEVHPEVLIVAMGRYGGNELSYSSDLDAMFCYQWLPSDLQAQQDLVPQVDIAEVPQRIFGDLRNLLMAPSSDPAIAIDADLRPEGRQGPLARSFDAFEEYYSRWSAGWESQALLRARIVPPLTQLGSDFVNVIHKLRFPATGLSDDELLEIRKLKARMETERLPKGIDPKFHTKLGPGGLSDIEWLVQVIQMQYGHEIPALQTTNTRQALRVVGQEGLLDSQEVEILQQTWDFVTKIRNAITLASGKSTDVIPANVQLLARISYLMEFGSQGGPEMLNTYQQLTRKCRSIVMHKFYGNHQTR